MKSVAVAGVIFLLAGPALAGPFGIEMGAQPDVYAGAPANLPRYLLQAPPPSPLAGLDVYSVWSTPETGICYVGGFTEFDNVVASGSELRQLFAELTAALETSYGPGFLSNTFDNHDEPIGSALWMPALLDEERALTMSWSFAEPVDDIRYILVEVNADSESSGLVTVHFELTNFDACAPRAD